jgi:hypothetical protein
MRTAAVIFAPVAIVAHVAPASAQTGPPRELPPDFWIASYVDIATATTGGRAVLQGWAFDCRTGLQPFTQRPGTLMLHFAAPGRASFVPSSFTIWGGGERPDVAAVYQPQHCPSVGSFTGFAIVSDAPPAGTWRAVVSWVAFDGAGRQTPPHESGATIVVK